MSKQAKASNAQQLVHSLIRIVPGAHEDNLRTVRKVRAFIQNPEKSQPALWKIPAPFGSPLLDGSPFIRGQYITQAVPAAGMSPAYLLPLPGQRALILGSPERVDMDGALWDDSAQRWTNVKDLRILVNTPEGVTMATVESSYFIPAQDSTGPDQETVDSATAILDELEKRILDAQLEENQKPAPEAQEEGQENE